MALNKYIQLYTSYNVWANKQLGNVALSLDDFKFDEEVSSSFSSIRKTYYKFFYGMERQYRAS